MALEFRACFPSVALCFGAVLRGWGLAAVLPVALALGTNPAAWGTWQGACPALSQREG